MPAFNHGKFSYRLVSTMMLTASILSACGSDTTENTPPSTPEISLSTTIEGESFSSQLTATDAEGDNLTFSKTSGANWLTIQGDMLVGTPSTENVGENTIIVSVSDGTSSNEASLIIMVEAGNSAPSVPTISTHLATEDQLFSATLSATDSDGDELTFSILSGPNWLTITGNILTGTPSAQNIGNNNITIAVSDGQDSREATFSITVKDGGSLNILLVSMDDANQDHFGTFGSPVLPSPTPRLDQLASQGMKFTQAHTVAANCVPSRNVTLSGMYPHQNGVEGFRQVWKSRAPLLPDLMKANGYLVGLMGKDGHSTPYVPYNWDIMGTDPESKETIDVHREAQEAFAQAKDSGKPFFYMYNTHDPHRAFWGINKSLKINEEQTPRPSYVYAANEVVIPPSIPDLADVRLETQYYYSTLRRGDDLVGQVLDALEQSGMADNTLVIFYSDHGWAMPFAKTNLWNASTRTPLIVRWPGKIDAGSVNNNEMVSAVDFLPTILDVAGIDIPEQVEGNSVKPLLLGETQAEVDRSMVFKSYYENSGHKRRPMRAIQTTQYNYIFNPWSDGTTEMAATTTTTASFIAMETAAVTDSAIQARVDLYKYRVLEEFYDLENDPYELDNKIDDPAYQEIIDNLQTKLVNWMIETNDPALPAFLNRADDSYLAAWMAHQQLETNNLGTKLGRSKENSVFYPNNDYFNLRQGGTLIISSEQGLTANDYEAALLDENDNLVSMGGVTATLVSSPSHGEFSMAADGSFSYTPEVAFIGEDSFVYRADSVQTDDSANATVYLTVVGDGTIIIPNNAPSAPRIDITNGTQALAFNATLSATDEDNDSLTFSIASGSLPTDLTLSGTTISGTPTAAGTFNFTVNVTDGEETTQAALSIVIAEPANVAPTAPKLSGNSGTVAIAFSETLSSTDTDSLTFSIASGSLPTGLTLSGTTISGTPTAAGTFNFTVNVTDGEENSQAVLSIVIAEPANVAPTAPKLSGNTGTVAIAFSETLSSTDTDSLTFSIASGSLPTGLTLSGTTISGTPTAAGTFNFTVNVTDDEENSQAVLSIVIAEPANVAPTAPTLSGNTGTVAIAFSETLSSTDTDSLTFSIASGSLPTGLTLSGTTISGTPTAAGTFNFTVEVTDGAETTQAALSIVIASPANVAPTAPTLSGNTGTVAIAFNETLSSTDTDSLTFSIASGSLPTGLTISGTTISGTPTAAGTFNFTVNVTDGEETTQAALSIVIAAPANVAPTAPTLSDNTGKVGFSFSETVAATDADNDSLIYSAVNLPAGLTLSGTSISGTPTAAGSFDSVITVDDGTDTTAATLTFDIAVNTPPTAPVLAVNTGAVDVAYSRNLSSTDVDFANSLLTYTATGLPDGLSLEPDSNTISGTPTTEGTYEVDVVVSDGVNDVAGTVTMIIAENTAPSAPQISLNTGIVGAEFTAELSATDVEINNANLTYTATNLPLGLTLVDNTISGTPTTANDYDVEVTVSDGVNSTQATLTISITAISGTILFSDDFESTAQNNDPVDATKWTIDGSVDVSSVAKNTGTYGGRLRKGGDLATIAIDTLGYSSIDLSYDRQAVALKSGDSFVIEWSTNGSDWTNIETVALDGDGNSEYTNKEFTLSGAENQASIFIRFNVTSGGFAQKGRVDNVVITGT